MVANIIHRSLVPKPTNINSVWPIFESDVIKSQPVTEERISEIMKRYGSMIKKKKDA